MRTATRYIYRQSGGQTAPQSIDPRQLCLDAGGTWHRSYGCAPCPICQPERGKEQNALTIAAKGDKLLLHCKKSGCGFRDLLSALGVASGSFQVDRVANQEAECQRQEKQAKTRAKARSIWDNAKPVQGTPAETYLRKRGIICDLPDCLRWLADHYHQPSGQFAAAMVADVTPTGGIHRTYFTKKGVRLNKSAKMMLGPCAGGAVRLTETQGPLVVCEGIETGLSLMGGLLSGFARVWACLSTSGMKALRLPEEAGELIIATDGDSAGREAGERLAHDATCRGWRVSMMPAPDGKDWNDVLQEGGANG